MPAFENHKHFGALRMANQATQEANQYRSCERFPVQNYAQFAPVGYGRIMLVEKRLPLT